MYRVLLTILFSAFSCLSFAQRATDTFALYFDLSIARLTPVSEKKIDLLIYNDKIITGSSVMIVGYADYLGTEKRNQALSMQRAENVKNYLVKYGINAKDIKVCTGRGEVDRAMKSQEGYPTDRRVDIVVNNRPKKKSKGVTRYKADTASKVAIDNIDEINKLKPGSLFLLKNVYFPPDRHIINPASSVTLEKLFVVLKNNPKLKISIEGHVCCVSGDAADAWDVDTYELSLSLNRAKEIYNYLVNKGIAPERLKYVGYGKRRPVVAYEQNETDAEKNRRVEIRVVEN